MFTEDWAFASLFLDRAIAAKNAGYDIYALSFAYGQRHDIEIECATNIAKKFGVKEHKIATIDLRTFGSVGANSVTHIKLLDVYEGPVTFLGNDATWCSRT